MGGVGVGRGRVSYWEGVTFSTCNDICYKGLGKEKA